MRMRHKIRGNAVALMVSAWLTGCGGGGGGSAPPNDPPPPVVTHTVGGTVSGLAGSLTLRNNGGNDLNVTADGQFAFSTALATGSAFSVTILDQPDDQTCAVNGGTGTVGSADVTSVTVVCETAPNSTGGGSLDTSFGSGGKVTTDFSGAVPPKN
jgi:hypothetical protein